MDYCAFATDKFLNSTFLNTCVLGLFSLLLAVATVVIAVCQYRFQKNSHEQKLLLDRENRILDIYKVFGDCGRVFITKYPSANLKLGILPNELEVKKQQEHRSLVCNTFGMAKLIFKSDPAIIGQLEKIMKKFLELSSRELQVILAQREVFMKAFEQVRVAFADKGVVTLQDVWLNQDAFDMLNKLSNTQDVVDLERGIESFWNNELSDDNFDKYFEPYISKIPRNALE
ncbi:hypothetical protein [Fibrobacter sp. UWB10]|uniref:hypothetical protein n=1 Tax=Fibrobacter sp. UWB10 TaxID=1896201 RepID=UPI0024037A49|nr:hypothetical protein [Fibrobacter sp. UWB10]SMP47408.1 hypothetical protein SAMN05720465_1403 [Fibrobacter sp. UWB10]